MLELESLPIEERRKALYGTPADNTNRNPQGGLSISIRCFQVV